MQAIWLSVFGLWPTSLSAAVRTNVGAVVRRLSAFGLRELEFCDAHFRSVSRIARICRARRGATEPASWAKSCLSTHLRSIELPHREPLSYSSRLAARSSLPRLSSALILSSFVVHLRSPFSPGCCRATALRRITYCEVQCEPLLF